MIAVDTHLLVYAHREDSPWHDVAAEAVQRLAEGKTAWAIPWPCLHEFIAIVTHPRIWAPPTPQAEAIDQVEAWLESPSLHLLGESTAYWPELRASLEDARALGPLVHEARVAALCRMHGVRELWAVDRDFGRFSSIAVRNPLGR